jgi:hypothetical protein
VSPDLDKELEGGLRAALRPVDPGEDFTARVLAQVGDEPQVPAGTRPMRIRSAQQWRSRRVWLPAALAATFVLTVIAAREWQQQQQSQTAGLQARLQVMAALRVTSAKLDLAYRMVNNPS